MDVASWLRDLGLERYEAAFRENDVRAEDLCHLTAEDLDGLGVAAIGHRRRLLVAIAKLNEQRPTDAATAVVPPPTTVPRPVSEDAVSHGGERRQLTVMFCDLVGSTALSEKLDPEELRSLLHTYRIHCGEVIARYDGFVARYVGDGILTYFGWPTAHEEDAERALRAALEIVLASSGHRPPRTCRCGLASPPVLSLSVKRPARGTSQSWRWAARLTWPPVCKDWPPATRLLSPPRPVAWSATRLN